MSRILLLNQYYSPDTSATAALARDVVDALSAAGHTVTVLSGRPSYDPAERFSWRWLRREVKGEVSVERVGSFAFSRHRMPGRVANYASYLVLALLRGFALPTDVVLVMTDPPVAVVIGAIVAGWHRVPLVYNVRDLHPDMAIAAGLVHGGIRVSLWEALHRWALRRAARVIVLGEDMRRRVIAKQVSPDRIAVVRDGTAVLAGTAPRDDAVSREVRCGFPFVVMHAGNLGFAGAWETLLAAAAALQGDGTGFVFVGGGAAATGLRAQAASLENVRFLPFRPAAEVPLLLAAGDLQIVTVRRGLEGLVVPSKLYPVLAAGRPVLAVAPEGSDVAAIVREVGCGWVADPDSPQAVASAVREARTSPAELTARGARGRAAAPTFNRAKLLATYVREVEHAFSA